MYSYGTSSSSRHQWRHGFGCSIDHHPTTTVHAATIPLIPIRSTVGESSSVVAPISVLGPAVDITAGIASTASIVSTSPVISEPISPSRWKSSPVAHCKEGIYSHKEESGAGRRTMYKPKPFEAKHNLPS